MNNTNSNTSCTLNNNNSNLPSPVNIPNVQSPNSQLSQQSKMTDSHQSIDDQIVAVQHHQRSSASQQLHSLHQQQQQIPHQSVFTIEQIELIRRLRKTNLTINQFVEAYSEMERLEEEMMDKKDLSFDNSTSSITNQITYALNNSNVLSSQQQLTHQQILQQSASGHYQSHNQLTNHHYNSLGQNHTSQQLNNSFTSDDNIELINFKKKGEQAMLLEIRAFVSKYNVRQSMISEATGISQGYISTFFHGEKMSEKRKNIIYQWYLTYSKNPAKLAADRQQINLNSLNNSGNSKFNHDFNMDNSNHFMGANNDVLFPITRRDRFIFRKQHLKILESFFESNPYPEIHTKEQIVEECNSSAEKSSGKPLKEADKVTVAIVSNWFNNKRKNARSKHLKQQFNPSTNNDLSSLTLSSHSLNSSTGSANLSQSSNPGYNLNNSPSPASSANPYLTSIQQPHHQLQQPNHQQDNNFESNYGYDCNNYNNNQSANDQNNQHNNQQQSSANQQNNQMHIVRNSTPGIQFKNEPPYSNYLDGCFNKLPNANSTNSKSDNENDLGQDHGDGSNIESEFSSQASFNGNDSIDN